MKKVYLIFALLFLGAWTHGAAPQFSNPHVLLSTGDSQSLSTISAADQASCIATYVVTPQIKILNFSGAWVTYTPGIVTGTTSGTGNTGACGTEIGYINSWRATYPNDNLWIIKPSFPGAYQTIGAPLGAAANITSAGNNTYTLNSGSVSSNVSITGTGIETGVYIPFSNFLALVGIAGGRTGPAFGSFPPGVDITQYNGFISWSVTQGLIYPGGSAGVSGVNAVIASGLALLTNPVIDIHIHDVGTNDAALATAATFQTDATNFRNKLIADLGTPYANTKMVIMRSSNPGTSLATVRAAQTAFRNMTTIFMLNTDTFVPWSPPHWDLADQTTMGVEAFQIFQGTYSGI